MTRDQLLDHGVVNLRDKGWFGVNKTNILMDQTYSTEFRKVLSATHQRLKGDSADRPVFEKLIAEIDGYSA